MTVSTISRPTPQMIHRTASSQAPANQQEVAAAPKDGYEVVAQNFGRVSLIKPLELTDMAGALGKAPSRIDSVKEVLTVQDAWDLGITGAGVGVAVIDTGVYPHPDLEGRLTAFKDYVKGKDGVENAYDDNGHGSHCAGLVGGDGKMADGQFKGPAYECDIIGVKVLDGMGGGNMSNVVKGIQWCIRNKERYNIQVASLSLGAGSNLHEDDDIVAEAVKACLEAGIVPVVAAGNSGPARHTIGSPAISSSALTVGAYDDKNTATHDDDTMAFFSSRGPTTRDKNIKPDIAAPGVQMVSHRSPRSSIDTAPVQKYEDHYVLLSGTSMATPVVAGVAALVRQANPDLTAEQVISILKETAEPMKDTKAILGGRGLVDPGAAVRKALEMKEEAEKAAAAEAAAQANQASQAPADNPQQAGQQAAS